MNKDKHKHEKSHAINNHSQTKLNSLKRLCEDHDCHKMVEKSIGRAKFKKFKDKEETELDKHETSTHSKTDTCFSDKNSIKNEQLCSDSKHENTKNSCTTKMRPDCIAAKRPSGAKCGVTNCNVTEEKHKKNSYEDKARVPDLSASKIDKCKTTEQAEECVSNKNCNSDEPKIMQLESKINRQTVAPVISTSKIVKGRLSELSHKSSLMCDRTSTSNFSIQKSLYTCTNAETSSQISKSSGQILSLPSKNFCPETVITSNVLVDGNSSSSHVDDGARKSVDPKMGQPAAIPITPDLSVMAEVTANGVEHHVAAAGRKNDAVVTPPVASNRGNSYTFTNKLVNDTDNTDVDIFSESAINEQISSRNLHKSRDKEVEESNSCTQDRERGEQCLRLKEADCGRDKSENPDSSHTKGFHLCDHSKNVHGNTLFNHSTTLNRSEVLNKMDVALSASVANDKDVALCRNNKHRLTVENKVNDTATCELKDNITDNVASGITAASPMVENVENQNQSSEPVSNGVNNSKSGHTGTQKINSLRDSGCSTGKQSSHSENCKKKGCTVSLESTVHMDREGQQMNNRGNSESGFLSTKDHSVNYTPCKTKTSRKIEASLKRPCVQEQQETDCQRKRFKEVSRASESGKRKSKLSLKLEELFGADECDVDDISGGHTNSSKISKTPNLPDINKEIPEIGRKSTASSTVEQCSGEAQSKLLPPGRENNVVKKSLVLDSNKTRAPDLKAKVLLAKPKLKQKIEQCLVNRDTKRVDKEEGITGKSQYSERSKSAKEKVMQNWFSDATNPPACSKSRCTDRDTAAINPHNIPWQLKKVDLPNISPKSIKDYYRQSSEKSCKPLVAKVGIHKRNSFPPMPYNNVDEQMLVRNDDILSSAVQGRRHSDTEFIGNNVNDKSERLIESCETVLKLQKNTVSEKIGILPTDDERGKNISTSNKKGALPIPHKINSSHNENLETENVEVSLTSVVVKDEAKVHDENDELSAEQQDEEKVCEENKELSTEQQEEEKDYEGNEELSAEQQEEEKVGEENELSAEQQEEEKACEENELEAEHHITESEPLNSGIGSRNNDATETTSLVEGSTSPTLLPGSDDNLESLQEGGIERGVKENGKESVSAERSCSEIGLGVITEETKQSLHAEPSIQSMNKTVNGELGPNESIIKEEPKDTDTSKMNDNSISLESISKFTKETLGVINNELENGPGPNKDNSENPDCNLQLEENRLQPDGAEAISCISAAISSSPHENKIGSIRVKDPLTLGIDIKRLESDSATRAVENYVKLFPQQIQDDLTDLTSLFITGFMDFDRYKARKNDAEKLPGTSREIELTCAHKDFVLSFQSKCKVVIKKVNFLKLYFEDKFEKVLHTFVNKRRPCTTQELDQLYQTFFKQESQNINLASENTFDTQAEQTKNIVNSDDGNNTQVETQSLVREVQNSIKRCYQKMLVTNNSATNAVTDISQSLNGSREELNDAVNVLAYQSCNSERGISKTVYQGNNSGLQPDTLANVKSVPGENANARDSVSSQAARSNVQTMTTRPSSEQISSCTSNLNGTTAARRVDMSQHKLGSLQPIISLVEQMVSGHHRPIGDTFPGRAQVRSHSEDETRRSFPPSCQSQQGCTLSGQPQSQNGGILLEQSRCPVPGQPQSQPECQLSGRPLQRRQSQPGCQLQGQVQHQLQSQHQQSQLGCQPPPRKQIQQQLQQQLQLGCPPPGQPQQQQQQQQQSQSQQQQPQLWCQPPGWQQVQQQSQQQHQQQQLGCQSPRQPQVQQQSQQQQQQQLQLGCQPLGQPQTMPQHGCPQLYQEWQRRQPQQPPQQQQQPQPGFLPLEQLQQKWSPTNQQQQGGVTSQPLQFGLTTSNLRQVLIRYQNPQNSSAPTSNSSQLQGARLFPYTSQPQVCCPPPYSSYMQVGPPPNTTQASSKQRPQQESYSASNWSQLPSYHIQQQYGALHSSMANGKAQDQTVNGYRSSNLNLPSSQNFPQPANIPANHSQAQWGHLSMNSNTVQAGYVPLEQTHIGCIPLNSNRSPIETSCANDLQLRQLLHVPSYVNQSHTGNQPINQENTNHRVLSQTFPQQMSHSTAQVSQVSSAHPQVTQMVYQDKLRYMASKSQQNQPASTVPQGSQLPPHSVHGGKVPSNLTNSVIAGHTRTSCGTTNRVTPQQTTVAACPSKVVPDSHFVDAQSVTFQNGGARTTLVRTHQNTFHSAPNGTTTGVLRSHLQGRQEYQGTHNSSSGVECQVNSVTYSAVIQNSGVKETPSSDENRNYVSTITGITNVPVNTKQPEKQQGYRLQQTEQQSNKTPSVIQGISEPQQNVTSTSSVQVMSVRQQTINSRTRVMDVPSSGTLTAQHSNANCAVVNSQVQRSYRTAAVWQVPNGSQQAICKTVSQNSVAVSPGEQSHRQFHVSRQCPNILNKQSANKKDLLAHISAEASAVKSGMRHETNSENNRIPSNNSVPSVQRPATSQSQSVLITLRNLLRDAPDISVTAVNPVSKKNQFICADKDQNMLHEMVSVTTVDSNSRKSSVSMKAQEGKLSPQVYTETAVRSTLNGTKVMESGNISCHPVSTQSLVSHDYAVASLSVNDSSSTNSASEGGQIHSPEQSDGLHVSCTTVEKPSVPLLTHCDRRTKLSHVTVKEGDLTSTSNIDNCLLTSVTELNAVQHQIPAASGDISYSSKLVGKIPSNHEESSSSSSLVYSKDSLSSGCASHIMTPPEMNSKRKANSEILVSEARAVRSSAVCVNTALNSPTSGNIPVIVSSKESENCKHLAHNKSDVVCELRGNSTCESETMHSADGESMSTVRVEKVSVTCASKNIVPETDDTPQECNKQITEDFDSDCFPAENDVQCTKQIITSENISNETEGMEELEVREFIESDLSVNSEMSIKLMSRVCFDTKREVDSDSAHLEISERRNHSAEAIPADMNTVSENIKILLGKRSEVNIDTPTVAASTVTMDNPLNSATKILSSGYGTDRENSSVTEKIENTMSKSVTPLSVSCRQSQDCYGDILDVKRKEVHCSLEDDDDDIEIIEDYSPVQFIGYKFAKDEEIGNTSSGSQHIQEKDFSSKSTDIDSVKELEAVIGGKTAEETGSKDMNNETTKSESLKIVSVVSLTPRATGESDIQWPSSPEPRTVSRDSGYTTPSDGAVHDAQEIHVDGDINCAFCENTAQILCTGCYITCYCSTDCQIRHWQEVHFEECKLQMVME